MLNEVQAAGSAAIRAPYSVDVTKGSVDGTVSKQWMSRPGDQRFNTLDDLLAFKRQAHEASWEYREKSNGLGAFAPEVTEWDDTYKLFVNSKAGPVVPTHWAFGQICKLAKMPASYFREVPSQMVVDHMTYRLKHSREVEELKLYGNVGSLLAATGPEYGRVPDWQIVQALTRIAGNGLGQDGFHWKAPGKLDWSNGTYDPENMGPVEDRTFYASDRDMFVFLVDDRRPIVVGKTRDGRDDNMFRGFYIQNSEVGSRSLKISAFYLRGVCMNRNLWGCEGFEEITIRHSSLAPERWLQQAQPALESFATGSSAKLIEAVAKAKAAVLVDDKAEALAFLQRRNFSKQAADAIAAVHEAEEGHEIRSAWDMAQGITAYARSKINTDDRLSVELEAKRILDKVA